MLESHSESDLTARIQKITAEVLAVVVVVPDDHLIGARVEQSPSRGVGLASCLKLCELEARQGREQPIRDRSYRLLSNSCRRCFILV